MPVKPIPIIAAVFLAASHFPAFAGDAPAPDAPPAAMAPVSPEEAPVLIPYAESDLPLLPPTDLTLPPADLWQRIRNGFALPDTGGALVREQETWYASRPDYVLRMTERSRRYLFHIVEEVERRGMPTEIALLPMIESAYNPAAYSRSRASGIWQFIPSTGKHFGLRQGGWYDERRDVLAATDAALDYLQKLYDMFGSWDLALAAYNAGEGTVARAIARNRAEGLPADYANLRLPRETRWYVPKLQAVKNIVAAPEVFDLDLAGIPNQPYFTAISVPQRMDMALAARLAEIPLEEFFSLNPSAKHPLVTGSRTVLLPVDKAGIFSANLENNDRPLLSWRTYSPRRGERLDRIAARFGISAARLKELNGIPARRKASDGQALLVPAGRNQAAGARSGNATHVVKKGETLLGIAQRYGVTLTQLKAWNRLSGNRLALGQKLTVRNKA